jgi:hypothetical protein
MTAVKPPASNGKAFKQTLRSALAYVGERPDLTPADRAHLERWCAAAANPLWDKLAADFQAGEVSIVDPYSALIVWALRARAHASENPTWLSKKQAQQKWKETHTELVALAEDLDRVARRYRDCEAARPRRRPPPPDDQQSAPRSQEEPKRYLDWLEAEAERLRKLAAREPQTDFLDGFGHVPEHISRQSGGKGKHKHSRELSAFSRRMVNFCHLCFGRPHHQAVALMANIAFPKAYVDADKVRVFCKPTTREGRRPKIGTPER